MYRIDYIMRRLQKMGYVFKNQRGSHIIMSKDGKSSVCLVKHNQSTTLSRCTLKKICKQSDIDYTTLTGN